uniref:Uncharacterized protein n=1 Tax=Hucho hucho TaxID=62062 RepID=A0A4W5JTB2_9TELE
MTPLSLSFSSLLKNKDSLQKFFNYYNAFHAQHDIPRYFGNRTPWKKARLWERNFSAVSRSRFIGQVLAEQPCAKNYAKEATMCTTSANGQDMTNWLWSIYNETKKQTEALIPVISKNSVNPDTIFANNEMSLGDIEIYGFDYDYTLAFYSRHLHTLIFNIARDILIQEHRVMSVPLAWS